jgi:hypothetical protein
LNNIKFGKRAIALLLTAMVLASIVPLLPIQFSAKAASTTTWVCVLKDTLNETVKAGDAKVELWNYTFDGSAWTKIGKVAGPVTVGEDGLVEMDLPQMWNASGTSGTYIVYVLVVKWTPEGKSTPFLLFNNSVMELSYELNGYARGKVAGGELLNMTEDRSPTIHVNVDNEYFGPDAEYPVYMVWLGRAVVQALDRSEFPLTGASVEMILNATDHSTTSFIQIVNGTLGSEFLGNIPNYDANYEVGWAVFDVPVSDTRADVTTWDGYDTNLANATFLIRWKVGAVDPRNGPVVGKFTVYYTMPTTLPDEIGPSVNVDASSGLEELETYLNDEIFAFCRVEWSLFFMTDMAGNPWYTEQAKLKAKAMKLDGSDFYATYPFVGARVAPGIYLMRLPFNLTDVDVWDFKLKADVQWYSSVVNVTTLDDVVRRMAIIMTTCNSKYTSLTIWLSTAAWSPLGCG